MVMELIKQLEARGDGVPYGLHRLTVKVLLEYGKAERQRVIDEVLELPRPYTLAAYKNAIRALKDSP